MGWRIEFCGETHWWGAALPMLANVHLLKVFNEFELVSRFLDVLIQSSMKSPIFITLHEIFLCFSVTFPEVPISDPEVPISRCRDFHKKSVGFGEGTFNIFRLRYETYVEKGVVIPFILLENACLIFMHFSFKLSNTISKCAC